MGILVFGLGFGHVSLTHVTEDPAEFFTMIFGGEAFVDWYATMSDLNWLGLTSTGLEKSRS
jgi:hypothetical protein